MSSQDNHWSEESDPRDYIYTFSKSDPDTDEKWERRRERSRLAYAIEETFWLITVIILSIILGSILTSGVVLVYIVAFSLPFVYSFGNARRWFK
jgi:hypothetical protein